MKEERKAFSVRDIVIVLLVLATALIFMQYSKSNAKNGATAIVTIIGQETMYISLDEDNIYHVDAELPVTLEVQGGAIHFIHSVCPDHICENDGFISREGEQSTCMPAGVSVIIMEEE